MKKKFHFSLIILVFLAACSLNKNQTVTPTSTLLLVQDCSTAQKAGESIIKGDFVLDPFYGASKELSRCTIFLTPTNSHGTVPNILTDPDNTKGDQITKTDDNGHFMFTAVKKGYYFLVYQSSSSWNYVLDDNKPLFISVDSTCPIDLGTLIVK